MAVEASFTVWALREKLSLHTHRWGVNLSGKPPEEARVTKWCWTELVLLEVKVHDDNSTTLSCGQPCDDSCAESGVDDHMDVTLLDISLFLWPAEAANFRLLKEGTVNHCIPSDWWKHDEMAFCQPLPSRLINSDTCRKQQPNYATKKNLFHNMNMSEVSKKSVISTQ